MKDEHVGRSGHGFGEAMPKQRLAPKLGSGGSPLAEEGGDTPQLSPQYDPVANWTMVASYIPGIIAMIDQTGKSNPPPVYYFMKDRLGSTRELVNAAQTVVRRYDYDVWSNTTEDQLVGAVPTRYRAGGLEYLADDLYAKSKAMYEPTVGRDVQPNFDVTMLSPDGGRYDSAGPALGVAQPLGVRPCCGGPPIWHPLGACDPHSTQEGWCEMWLIRCRAACDRSCESKNWRRPVCYRCCQCYYKRCWTACGEGHDPGDPPAIRLGPPSRCKFPFATITCPKVCDTNAIFWGFAVNSRKCDDEQGGNKWYTICGHNEAHGNTWMEYGQTVKLQGYGKSVDGCWHCTYHGVEGLGVVTISTQGRGTRDSEDCPDAFPYHLSSYYGPGCVGKPPWPPHAELAMWNTCP